MNFRDYSPEDLRALSQRAGVASGAARREKRSAIEHEKITAIALREQHRENLRQQDENIRVIRQVSSLLLETKKAADKTGGWYG